MGVFIKGMKMPKECRECYLLEYYEYLGETQCSVTRRMLAERGKPISFDGRPGWCPLIEVQEPHGDLVDRDILEQELRNGIKAGNYEEGYEHYAHINNMDDCVECVRYADTVIEAEIE